MQNKWMLSILLVTVFLIVNCAQSGKRLDEMDQKIQQLNLKLDTLSKHKSSQIERRQELVGLIQNELEPRDKITPTPTPPGKLNQPNPSPTPIVSDSSLIQSVPIDNAGDDNGRTDQDNSFQQSFQQAQELYEKNNYANAAYRFYEVYLNANENNPLKESGLYKAGESFYLSEDWNQTIDTHFRLFREFPQSEHIPQALLQVGKSYEALQQAPNAKAVYRHLLEHYPDSTEAQIIQENSRLEESQ